MSKEFVERWGVLSKQFDHKHDVNSTVFKELGSLTEVLLLEHPWLHPENIDPFLEYRLHIVKSVSSSAMDNAMMCMSSNESGPKLENS